MTLTGRGLVAGVLGDPVTHSLSPRLHNHWLARYGIDGGYVPFPTQSSFLEPALRGLAALGVRGCNVTLPHKETAFLLMDSVDPIVRRIGAVNTVVIDENGAMHGSNTDGLGFLSNLYSSIEAWSPVGGPAVLLGAGGAARAIVVALVDAGCPEIRIVNRTKARAEALIGGLGGCFPLYDWQDRTAALKGAALLVNTTVLGMSGHPALDIDLDLLPPTAVVTDIVYTPLWTPLLIAAKARGNPTVDGLGMLLHQARPGFEAWFGVRPTVDAALRAAVL